MKASTASALCAELWQVGYRPLLIHGASETWLDLKARGKRPIGKGWQDRARQTPPAAVSEITDPRGDYNVGLLCDGLRAADVDIDDHSLAEIVTTMVLEDLGVTPLIRCRAGSPRVMPLYTAAEGEPVKLRWESPDGHALEFLGKGQQTVCYGTHYSGSELEWLVEFPHEVTCNTLPTVTEEQITTLLNKLAAQFGGSVTNGDRHHALLPDAAIPDEVIMPIGDVVAALDVIPCPAQYDQWLSISMAVHAATGGSAEGFQAWDTWCSMGPSYPGTAKLRTKWNHISPSSIGPGTLVAEARHHKQGWRSPSRDVPYVLWLARLVKAEMLAKHNSNVEVDHLFMAAWVRKGKHPCTPKEVKAACEAALTED